MKKFVSSLLIFSMVFTGLAATSCFAEESYQADYQITNGHAPLNFYIAVPNGAAVAKAEAKAEAEASKGSKIATVAKIALLIALILTVKKYGKAAVEKLGPMIENIKAQLGELKESLGEKIDSLQATNETVGSKGDGDMEGESSRILDTKTAGGRFNFSELFSGLKKTLVNVLWDKGKIDSGSSKTEIPTVTVRPILSGSF